MLRTINIKPNFGNEYLGFLLYLRIGSAFKAEIWTIFFINLISDIKLDFSFDVRFQLQGPFRVLFISGPSVPSWTSNRKLWDLLDGIMYLLNLIMCFFGRSIWFTHCCKNFQFASWWFNSYFVSNDQSFRVDWVHPIAMGCY